MEQIIAGRISEGTAIPVGSALHRDIRSGRGLLLQTMLQRTPNHSAAVDDASHPDESAPARGLRLPLEGTSNDKTAERRKGERQHSRLDHREMGSLKRDLARR